MGVQLHELMGWDGPITYRQYRVWEAWLEAEWNRPSRLEYYVMQLGAIIQQVNSKKGTTIKLDSHQIKFKPPARRRRREPTAEEATAVAIGQLMHMFGGMPIRGLPKRYGGDAPDDDRTEETPDAV